MHKTDLEISQVLSLQGQQFKFVISLGLLLTVENADGYKRKDSLKVEPNLFIYLFIAMQTGKMFSLHSSFCKYQRNKGRNDVRSRKNFFFVVTIVFVFFFFTFSNIICEKTQEFTNSDIPEPIEIYSADFGNCLILSLRWNLR